MIQEQVRGVVGGVVLVLRLVVIVFSVLYEVIVLVSLSFGKI